MAELGVAAHWIYKEGSDRGDPPATRREAQVGAPAAGRRRRTHEGSGDFVERLKGDLVDDEVFVFTPKGEVKSLAAGATPLDFAYEIHTDVGHRCVGAKVNGKMVPLSYKLRSGEIVEVLTAKRERGPSRDWLGLVKTTRARNKIKQWFKAESRKDTEHSGRELLQEALRKQGMPAQRVVGSPLLADVVREMGFRKADDFYIALGGGQDHAQGRRAEGAAAPQAGRVGGRADRRRTRCRTGRRRRGARLLGHASTGSPWTGSTT